MTVMDYTVQLYLPQIIATVIIVIVFYCLFVTVLKMLSPGIELSTLAYWCLSACYQLSERVSSLARVVTTPVRHTFTRLHVYEAIR